MSSLAAAKSLESAIDPQTGLPWQLPEATANKKIREVSFDELPMTEVVRFLRESFPEINFIIPSRLRERAANMTLQIRLRNAGLLDILTAIVFESDREISWVLAQKNLVVFELMKDPPAEKPVSADRTVKVINVSRLFRVQGLKEIPNMLDSVRELAAETLKQLYGDNPSPSLPDVNYHPGTGVCILVGSESSIKVYMDILTSIEPRRFSESEKPGTTPALPSGPGK